MSVCLLVVCEDRADFRIASELADRVICERVERIDRDSLADHRSWWVLEAERTFVKWIEIRRVAEARGLRLRPRSRFGGEPGPLTRPLPISRSSSRPSWLGTRGSAGCC